MDLHRAVGQLITGKVFGPVLDDATQRLIADGTISGVTLFKPNGSDLRQLAALVDSLHTNAGPQTDFLVSVDEEGGAVQRFEHIISPLPSAMALAALRDPQSLEWILSLHAGHLSLLGINCNLVPVLDVNSNPLNPIIATRSYGDQPALIAEFGKIVARIYLQNGVLPVGKHFPGHGDTAQDTHLEMVALTADAEMLPRRELMPFALCKNELPAMLVAHVWVKALDDESLPASLSPKVVNGLLRQQMQYDKFVITDDMPGMNAIAANWGLEEAAVRAIGAGIDHVLMCGSVSQVSAVHAAVMRAVQSGIISEKILENAIRRRRTAMQLTARRREPLTERIELIESSLESCRRACREISAASTLQHRGHITRMNNSSDEWILLVPDHPRYRMNLLTSLTRALPRDASVSIQERRYSLNPRSEDIDELESLVAGKRCILLTYRSLLNKGQVEMGKRLATVVNSESSLLVSTDVPYDLECLPEWPNAVALFDPSDQGMDGFAHLLTTDMQPRGVLPVQLSTV